MKANASTQSARESRGGRRAVFILAMPLHKFSVFLHVHLHIPKGVTKYGSAASLTLFGGYLASNPVHFLPHFVWDTIAYGLHGIALAPIAECVCHGMARFSALVEDIETLSR